MFGNLKFSVKADHLRAFSTYKIEKKKNKKQFEKRQFTSSVDSHVSITRAAWYEQHHLAEEADRAQERIITTWWWAFR